MAEESKDLKTGIPSTWETIRLAILMASKIWNIIETLTSDPNFTSYLNELDDSIKGLKNAKSLSDRVDAATRLTKLARRL